MWWQIVCQGITTSPTKHLPNSYFYVAPSRHRRTLHASSASRDPLVAFTTLRLSTKPAQDSREPTPSMIETGLCGCSSFPASISEATRSWMLSQPGHNQQSMSAMLKFLGTGSLQDEIKHIWMQSRSGRPWTKWQRSSGPMAVPTNSNLSKKR